MTWAMCLDDGCVKPLQSTHEFASDPVALIVSVESSLSGALSWLLDMSKEIINKRIRKNQSNSWQTYPEALCSSEWSLIVIIGNNRKGERSRRGENFQVADVRCRRWWWWKVLRSRSVPPLVLLTAHRGYLTVRVSRRTGSAGTPRASKEAVLQCFRPYLRLLDSLQAISMCFSRTLRLPRGACLSNIKYRVRMNRLCTWDFQSAQLQSSSCLRPCHFDMGITTSLGLLRT